MRLLSVIVGLAIITAALWPGEGITLNHHPTITQRILWPFCHANIFHAAANIYCLHTLWQYYRFSPWQLLTAYIIAVAYTPPEGVTVTGASGVCFALIGLLFWHVRRRWLYASCAIASAIIPALLPGIAAHTHMVCLICGTIAGTLTAPLIHSSHNSHPSHNSHSSHQSP